MNKAIVYYTNNRIHEGINKIVKSQLVECSKHSNVPIISVVQKSIKFGDMEIVVGPKESSPNSIFEQVYIGCCAAFKYFKAEAIFTAEHDVLYYKGYHDFSPMDDSWSFERAKWYMDNEGFKRIVGHSLSTLCARAYKIIANFSLRYYRGNGSMGISKGGFRASEPGEVERPCGFRTLRGTPDFSCIDIRHSSNFSRLDLESKSNEYTNCVNGWLSHSELKERMGWK